MLEKDKRGVQLTISKNRMTLHAELVIDWRKVGLAFLLLLCMLATAGSSLDNDVRNLFLEIALNWLQNKIFQNARAS